MASDLQQQLESIRAKALVVVEKYDRLKQAYDTARNEIADLKAQVLARDEELERLKMKVEYLSIASTVRLTSDDLASARTMVADLVREIDRCIADLLE